MTENYLFYTDVYRGAEIPEKDFPRYYERACDIVNALIFGRLDSFADDDGVKKAICAQTELMYSLGEECLFGEDGVSHEEIGSASVTYGKSNCLRYNGIPVSAVTVAILSSSGAGYRGI